MVEMIIGALILLIGSVVGFFSGRKYEQLLFMNPLAEDYGLNEVLEKSEAKRDKKPAKKKNLYEGFEAIMTDGPIKMIDQEKLEVMTSQERED